MQDDLLAQARALHDTVRLLRLRVLRHCSAAAGQNEDGSGQELTVPQMNLLMVVREREQATVRELADALQVSAPSISAMVDRLVDIEVLTREQSLTDRRSVAIRLSALGRSRINDLEETILNAIVDLLKKIGPDYAQKWCEVYDKLREVLLAEENSDVVTAQRSE